MGPQGGTPCFSTDDAEAIWNDCCVVNLRWIVGLLLQVLACLVAVTAVVALSSIGPLEFLLLVAVAVALAFAGHRLRSTGTRRPAQAAPHYRSSRGIGTRGSGPATSPTCTPDEEGHPARMR